MFKLDVRNSKFPAYYPAISRPTGVRSCDITFSKSKLCWAALTVGRSNKVSVKTHSAYWQYEAQYRWNMVRASINMSRPNGRLRNSALFNALDPTEKGGINFYLGMIFTKLCAQELLSIPWLIHFDWMKNNHSVSKLAGKSSPDLLGYSPTRGSWNVFEAKGRNSGFSRSLIDKAKNQSTQVTAIDGQPCELHVGAMLYRSSTANGLQFFWEDPEPDGDHPFELKTDRETWLQYYAPIWSLYQEQEKNVDAFQDRMGFKVSIHDSAIRFVEALEDSNRNYSNELGTLFGWSRERTDRLEKIDDDGWNGDGLCFSVNEE